MDRAIIIIIACLTLVFVTRFLQNLTKYKEITFYTQGDKYYYLLALLGGLVGSIRF